MLLLEQARLRACSLDMVPSKLKDYPRKDWMKMTSQAYFKFYMFWQKDSNQGTTLAGRTRKSVCFYGSRPLLLMIRLRWLIKSRMPKL